MTTFLEYLLTQYLGPADRVASPGESYWECPRCGSSKFHTMPEKPEYKHRAKCWKCNFRGDAADMLRFFHPDEDWGERKWRLKDLRAAYQRSAPSLPGDRGEPAPDEQVAAAVAELLGTFEHHVAGLTKIAGVTALCLLDYVSRERGVDIDAVLREAARSVLRDRRQEGQGDG